MQSSLVFLWIQLKFLKCILKNRELAKCRLNVVKFAEQLNMNSLCVSGSHARLHQRDFIEVINILYQADSKEKNSTNCPKVHVHSKTGKALPRRVRRITLKHSFRSDNDVTVKNNLAGSQEKRGVRREDENEAAADEFKTNRKRSQSLPPVKKINNFNRKVVPAKSVSTDDDVTNAGFVTSAVEWRKKMVEYQEEILRLRRRVRQQDDVIERNKQQVSGAEAATTFKAITVCSG